MSKRYKQDSQRRKPGSNNHTKKTFNLNKTQGNANSNNKTIRHTHQTGGYLCLITARTSKDVEKWELSTSLAGEGKQFCSHEIKRKSGAAPPLRRCPQNTHVTRETPRRMPMAGGNRKRKKEKGREERERGGREEASPCS